MADADPHPVDHPTQRLVGNAPAVAALRAQIRHLAPFDTLGSPAVPTLLTFPFVIRSGHPSGRAADGP
jgi:hypothetical protein